MEIGDKVVIALDSPYPNGPYKVGTVERVTKTFVVVDGVKYIIRYPYNEWGRGGIDYWHYNHLAPDMPIDQAEEHNEDWHRQNKIDLMRSALKRFYWSQSNISDDDVVTVYKTMKQMGLFKE